MPSIMFDAVLVPAGKDGIAAMAQNGDAVHYVMEAFKHCKAICTVGEGVGLLRALQLGDEPVAAGLVVAKTPVTNLGDNTAALQIAADFVTAIAKHRHWDRAGIDAIPA